MTLPVVGPTSAELVKAHLDITDNRDDAPIGRAVAAVNAKVRTWPVVAPADGAEDWSAPELAHIVEGATLLAARLFRRRNSPDGVAQFATDGPVYVSRNDPDVAMLLGLGQHQRPAVG